MVRCWSWSALVALLVVACAGDEPEDQAPAPHEAEVEAETEPAAAPRRVKKARRVRADKRAPADEPVMQTQFVEIDVEVPVEARDRMAVAGQEALEQLAKQRGYEGVKGVRLVKPSCDEKCRVHVEGEAWRQVPAATASSGSAD